DPQEWVGLSKNAAVERRQACAPRHGARDAASWRLRRAASWHVHGAAIRTCASRRSAPSGSCRGSLLRRRPLRLGRGGAAAGSGPTGRRSVGCRTGEHGFADPRGACEARMGRSGGGERQCGVVTPFPDVALLHSGARPERAATPLPDFASLHPGYEEEERETVGKRAAPSRVLKLHSSALAHPTNRRMDQLSKAPMLTRLSIRDIVLIARLDIELSAGLAVLTGETGAGKSILLDAFALALGARGDAALVRHGAEQGQVTACFDVAKNHPARAILAANDVAAPASEEESRA